MDDAVVRRTQTLFGAYERSGRAEKEGSLLGMLAFASWKEAQKRQLQLAEARKDPLEAST